MEKHADVLMFNVHRPRIGHYTFVYLPTPDYLLEDLDSIVLAAHKGPLLPDAIVLACPDSKPANSLTDLRSQKTQATKARLADRTPLVYLSLDTAQIANSAYQTVYDNNSLPSDLKAHLDDFTWIKSGLDEIFKEDLVVHRAPPGYAFHKPSGDTSVVFLKPDLAFRSSATISFIAFAILRRAFPSGTNSARELKSIYVDTMAISPAAFLLRDFVHRDKGIGNISVSSFHSYDGMENIETPISGTALCLISASSSMSLQDKWIREKSASDEEVLTLLTLSSARLPDRALYSLSLKDQESSPGPAELSIKIYGENFIPTVILPKKVLLRREAHKVDKEVDPVIKLRDAKIFDLHTVDRTSPGNPRAFHVDGVKLVESRPFND